MVRRNIVIFFLAAAIFNAHAEVNFSVRYYDKKIYYPDDRVELRVTLSNSNPPGDSDEFFHLADDPRQSFGFDLRSLAGDPVPLAEGYAAALNNPGAYRLVHLGPGEDLSLTIVLNDWVRPTTPEQYRLTGYFYPNLRGRDMPTLQADTVLDLTVLPETGERWQDELELEVRNALTRRDMDPLSVVEETLLNRSESKFNRALLYLDTESLARNDPTIPGADQLKRTLLEGTWDDLAGFEYPAVEFQLVSSQIQPSEASVRLIAAYQPFGERFERDLRFYLHKYDGFWSIRRVEALADQDADPRNYGAVELNPPDVVAELIRAAVRGDWEVALRYFDIDDLVRNLPDYSDRWTQMSARDQQQVLADYRSRLISGTLDSEMKPLTDIDTWRITGVNYTDTAGSVIVENQRTHMTAEGPLQQSTIYTFRLKRTSDTRSRWKIYRYDTIISRS